MATFRISGIGMTAQARAIAEETVHQAPSADRTKLRKGFKVAAQTDGNFHLTESEAAGVKSAYEASGKNVNATLVAIEAQVEAATAARDPDGIKSYFSSRKDDMAQAIIDAIRSAIDEADGAPVEINALTFSFTEKRIADELIAVLAAHPNVTVNAVADFTQSAESNGYQPARLAKLADTGEISRLSYKFKKDNAFRWDSQKQRPVYEHGLSKGLNHHKAVEIRVGGKPHTMIVGSYNWSPTAAKSNYENLRVVSANNPANRGMMNALHAEFVAFFNHPETLSFSQTKRFRAEVYNQLRVANGVPPSPLPPVGTPTPIYIPVASSERFDLNHLSDDNFAKLTQIAGSSLANAIISNYQSFGAFTSFENLAERVPRVAKLGEQTKTKLREAFEFGDGRVLINDASASELARALRISFTLATLIVDRREQLGLFQSVDELRGLPGMTSTVFSRIAPRINDDMSSMAFSSRAYSDSASGRGYAPENHARTYPVMQLDGTVIDKPQSLDTLMVDMWNRSQPGPGVEGLVAMYGMSASSPEFQAILAAVQRGIPHRIIMNKDFNEGIMSDILALKAQGLPIDVRYTSKTMHHKFGKIGNDAFDGSANASLSSIGKHSENRVATMNNDHFASDIEEEFNRLWAIGKTPAP